MKKILTLLFALMMVFEGFSQTYYSWDFNTLTSSTFPAGFVTWNLDGQTANSYVTTNISSAFSSTAGWIVFPTSANTGPGIAATCSWFTNTAVAADRWLVTAQMTIPTSVPNVCLLWNANSYDGQAPETYEVKISTTDSNTTSFTTTPVTITGENGSPTTRILPLAAYAGHTIRIAFRDISVNQFLLIMNYIKLVNLPSYSAHIADVEIYEHNYLTNAVPVTGQMTNKGFDTINSFTLNYSVNGAAAVTAPITGAGLLPQQSYVYTHPTVFNPATAGTYNIKVWFSGLNGTAALSDTASTTVFFYPKVTGLKKNVLIEEFTGAWCGYCPGGALEIRDILARHSYAVAVAIHDQNGGTTADDAMQIPAGHTVNNTYNTGYPSAMVDRLYYYDNQTADLGFNSYDNSPSTSVQDTATIFRHTQATPVNVSLSALSFDSTLASNNLTVTVNANFLDSLSQGDYRFNLYLVEDSVITSGAGYDQHNYYSAAGNNFDAGNSPLNALPAVITNNGQANNWTQNHVLRAMAGGAWGSAAIIPSAPSTSTTYSYAYTTTVSSSWRYKFISLIGVVQEYNTDINRRTILNVVEAPLLGGILNSIKETSQFNKLSVYPNPASTMATVDMDLKEGTMVNISVVNVLGQTVVDAQDNLLNAGEHTVKVPVSGLSEGLYFVKIIANGQTTTLPLSVSAK